MKSKIISFINTNAVVWKIPIAAALSWEIAKWAGSNHPYLSPLTVILSIQMTVSKSMKFAWQRVIGTIAGVLFTAIIAPYVGLSGWSIGLLLFVGAVIVARLKLDHAMMIQVALSILLVLYFQSKMPSYPLDRIRDTVIGAAVAVLIQILIFPPDSIHKAKKKTIRFADHLSNQFDNAAKWVEHGCAANEAQTIQTELQTLFQELHQATTEAEKADQSLNYNPLAHKKRNALNQLTRQLDQLRSGYANLTDMVRIFTKWSGSSFFTKEDQRIWADHLNKIAELVKEWKKMLDDPNANAFDPSAFALHIKAPSDIENYQYPLALYTNAEQIIQDFKSPPFS
ncbi:FUSC family protein [Paenibacillus piri]|uniref:FUSC family protein n=1 Tax=Paenibacillus piri TaxID=2547395 RepID=A0A4R5KT18_9BACL|nr:aromatic acid exporter family protein [Paenibacillus piri]TDF98020.1 FUSC family protein [Paenibacillus piri]